MVELRGGVVGVKGGSGRGQGVVVKGGGVMGGGGVKGYGGRGQGVGLGVVEV